ncbi:MAG: hypothetical protein HFJ94_06985 [Muribaculaceae bacterium]|nr:hypothetical protein [Muribaculaceae bacterium]
MIDTLTKIIDSPMLAPNVKALAHALGYMGDGRTSINSIRKGAAKNKAINSFMKRVKDSMGFNSKDISNIAEVISNASMLRENLRPEPITKSKDWQLSAILAIASADYSEFSDKFTPCARALEALRISNPDMLFASLLYFFITSTNYNFYANNLSFPQQCNAAFAPIASAITQKHPDQPVVKLLAEVFLTDNNYSNPDIIYPNLYSFIAAGAYIFRSMISTDAIEEFLSETLLLPQLQERTYWKTENPDIFMLLAAQPLDSPGSGLYHAIRIDRTSPDPTKLFTLCFENEHTAIIRNVDGSSGYNSCKLHSDTLEFSNPTPLGSTFTKIDLESATNLRAFNSRLSDIDIFKIIAVYDGYEPDVTDDTEDIIISRDEITLRFSSGTTATIRRDCYPSLASVTPDEEAVFVTNRADGSRFIVITPYITIPLSAFTITRPEQK